MNAISSPLISPVIRQVVLRTPDAGRLARFYEQMPGLVPRQDPANPNAVSLHHPVSGEALVTLLEEKASRPAPSGAPGLFHIAFLFAELDGWRAVVRKALALTGNFHGAADHGVSWAVYLEDPDGNGLELAWDKPANEWTWRGDQIKMVSQALPLRSILHQGPQDYEGVGPFSIGHLHLQVSSLSEADAYQREHGLRVTQADYPGALFLARGAYHHHLALNTWRTNPRVTRPDDASGLVSWLADSDTGVAREQKLWQRSYGN